MVFKVAICLEMNCVTMIKITLAQTWRSFCSKCSQKKALILHENLLPTEEHPAAMQKGAGSADRICSLSVILLFVFVCHAVQSLLFEHQALDLFSLVQGSPSLFQNKHAELQDKRTELGLFRVVVNYFINMLVIFQVTGCHFEGILIDFKRKVRCCKPISEDNESGLGAAGHAAKSHTNFPSQYGNNFKRSYVTHTTKELVFSSRWVGNRFWANRLQIVLYINYEIILCI